MDTSKYGMSQTAEKIAEYLYGHTRAKAIEWAKTEKFDSRYHQAEEILELIGFESLRQQLAEKDVGLDAATQIINQHVADLDTLTQQLADCEAAADLIAQRNAELEEDNQPKKDHIKHFRKQLAESQARGDDLRDHLVSAMALVEDDDAFRAWSAAVAAYDKHDSTALDEAIRQAEEPLRERIRNLESALGQSCEEHRSEMMFECGMYCAGSEEAIRQAKRGALSDAPIRAIAINRNLVSPTPCDD